MTDPSPNSNETSFGIFHLVNPPLASDADLIRKIIDHIDFDWDAIKPYMAKHFIDQIDIQWITSNNGSATASWWGTGLIEISTQFTSWRDDIPFVLAHEIGHMVDFACLTPKDHVALTTIFHSGPGMSGMMAHSNSGQYYKHPTEEWTDNDNDYVARLNENFADQFVAAIAPELWNGTATDLDCHQRWPRFVHYTDNNTAVRDIVESAANRVLNPPTPTPTPTPAPNPTPAKKVVMTRGTHIDTALHHITIWKRGKHSHANRVKVAVAEKALKSIKAWRKQ
jgi:hypothetical protein